MGRTRSRKVQPVDHVWRWCWCQCKGVDDRGGCSRRVGCDLGWWNWNIHRGRQWDMLGWDLEMCGRIRRYGWSWERLWRDHLCRVAFTPTNWRGLLSRRFEKVWVGGNGGYLGQPWRRKMVVFRWSYWKEKVRINTKGPRKKKGPLGEWKYSQGGRLWIWRSSWAIGGKMVEEEDGRWSVASWWSICMCVE